MSDGGAASTILARVPDELDSITLTGLAVQANHGVYDHERRDGQPFVVDVTVWLDTRAAAAADDLGQTVNYGVFAHAVHDAVAQNPVDLLETLAERIAVVALAFARVTVTRVTVHKPEAPIGLPFDDVAITITRSRA
ncbi:dihydroneopterin aldolase [Subtercola boreus]|uniref:7,8-dihydroneopterin aldolase n=1 Tax=Subtercola boreus TaxID=120213 RepID=A0A3E0W8V7_9MICO|nr:dihydroneopterin aldolase [Subtercola boreus]RFA18259.1 dihydroneopterin aldolase [Subtercola boreus]RFA18651.1 dihydroneopterin aldolase [Subtercola boreus]RFA25254.1 dihydroneopterin aldolase [Subtercola boreus]